MGATDAEPLRASITPVIVEVYCFFLFTSISDEYLEVNGGGAVEEDVAMRKEE